MENDFYSIVKKIISDFEESHMTRTFTDLDVDSFDLLTLRVSIEQEMGISIPDPQWVEFKAFRDIFNFCNKANEKKSKNC